MAFRSVPASTVPEGSTESSSAKDGQNIAMGGAGRRAGAGILRFPGTVYPLESPARQFTVRRETVKRCY